MAVRGGPGYPIGYVPPFAGRAAELAALGAVADRALAGVPQVVWVRGEAGIGKTGLVRRFVARVPRFTVLSATADPAETGVGFGVLDQLVCRRGPVRGAGDRVRPGSAPSEVDARLAGLAGGELPLAIVVDDAEWSDPDSVRALARLPARPGAGRLLIVLVTRASFRPAAGEPLGALLPGAGTVLDLGGLTPAGTGELAGAALGRELSARTVDRLHEWTGGNPRHLHTLLSRLPSGPGADEPVLPAPPSLVDAVSETRDALPGPTGELLEALAVLDGPAPLDTLTRLSATPDPESALRPALDAGLVRRRRGADVEFVGRAQRDVIYDALTPARRAALHARAADLVVSDAAWAHRVAAAGPDDDALASRLEEAAAARAAAGRHEESGRLLRWSADLSGCRPDHDRRLQASWLQRLLAAGDLDPAGVRADVEPMAPSALRALVLGLAALRERRDPADATAAQWLSTAVSWTDPAGRADGWVRAVAAAGLVGAHAQRGRTDDTLAAAATALYRPGLPPRLADHVRVLAATARVDRDGVPAAADGLDALGPGDDRSRLDVVGFRGALRLAAGRVAEARTDLSAALARTPAPTFLLPDLDPVPHLAALRYVEGDWDAVAPLLDRAPPRTDVPVGDRVLRRLCATLVPAGRGRWPVAEHHARMAHLLARRSGGASERCLAATADAVRHQALGDPAGIVAALATLRGDTGTTGPRSRWALWWRPLLVEGLLGIGRTDEALEQLAALRRTAGDSGFTDATLVRLTAAAAAADGDSRAAVALAGEFLHRPGPVVAPLAHGLLAHEHAGRLAAGHRVVEAVVWMRRARTEFGRLGATPFRLRVTDDLRRSGAPVPDRTGERSRRLTDRERQVADLVRGDLTNREIADRLQITTRTVEYHLGNVYAKLAISSRDGLRSLRSTAGDHVGGARPP